MIADKLNKLLKNNNMTAYRLARITKGITDAMIGRHCKGKSAAMYRNLVQIAVALDVEVIDDLLQGRPIRRSVYFIQGLTSGPIKIGQTAQQCFKQASGYPIKFA